MDENSKLVGILARSDRLKVFLRTDDEIACDVGKATPERAIKASVERGVVTLQGSVDTRSRADALERRISAIDGVVGVNSKLTFAVDDTR